VFFIHIFLFLHTRLFHFWIFLLGLQYRFSPVVGLQCWIFAFQFVRLLNAYASRTMNAQRRSPNPFGRELNENLRRLTVVCAEAGPARMRWFSESMRRLKAVVSTDRCSGLCLLFCHGSFYDVVTSLLAAASLSLSGCGAILSALAGAHVVATIFVGLQCWIFAFQFCRRRCANLHR